MKNIIFIRVDSSTKVGYGHFIRCMALADTLQKNFEINKTKLIKRKSPNYKKNFFELILFSVQLFKIFFKKKYDIIYLHDFYLALPVKLISFFS